MSRRLISVSLKLAGSNAACCARSSTSKPASTDSSPNQHQTPNPSGDSAHPGGPARDARARVNALGERAPTSGPKLPFAAPETSAARDPTRTSPGDRRVKLHLDLGKLRQIRAFRLLGQKPPDEVHIGTCHAGFLGPCCAVLSAIRFKVSQTRAPIAEKLELRVVFAAADHAEVSASVQSGGHPWSSCASTARSNPTMAIHRCHCSGICGTN